MAYINPKFRGFLAENNHKMRDVAKRLGIANARFSRLINGRIELRYPEALALAGLFDLEVEDVILEENSAAEQGCNTVTVM